MCTVHFWPIFPYPICYLFVEGYLEIYFEASYQGLYTLTLFNHPTVSPTSALIQRNWFRLSWLATMVAVGIWIPMLSRNQAQIL
jgi:hypothetical protein